MSDPVSTLYEYFASGSEDVCNPFLTHSSRKWAKNLLLKSSILSACFLAFAFIFHFINRDLSCFFLIFVYFLSGMPALIKTSQDLQELDLNIDVLMTLAALLSAMIGSELEGGLLLVLFALSEAMADMVTHKTKSAINSLHKLSPTMAIVYDEKTKNAYPKSVRDIDLDMVLLIKAGEIIPLDGFVIEGSSFVDLKLLTGESVPVTKDPGQEVHAGSLNLDGTLKVRVTKTSSDSTLSRIINLITEAQNAKPKLEKMLNRFSTRYATTIILLALSFGIFIPIFFPTIPYLGIDGSIYRALAFLIAASPCALIIALPTAYLSSISACAKKGVLLKGGAVLDALASCKTILFDKTGTLTTGNLSISKIEILSINESDPITETEAVRIAAGLERAVVHPIAVAIESYAEKGSLSPIGIEELQSIPGNGIKGTVEIAGEKHKAYIGRASFIEKETGHTWKSENIQQGLLRTVLFVKNSVVLFLFQDELRPELNEMLSILKNQLYFKIAMLTGDHKDNASYVAKKLHLDQTYADLQPNDKLEIVAKLSDTTPLVMVGDGINDAPSLARATVGIAMGKVGSQTAIEAADIVLLQDNLANISWLFLKAKKTMQIVRENISLALIVILFATTPSLLGYLPLWLAVILHEGGTVLVGLNSLRLLKK